MKANLGWLVFAGLVIGGGFLLGLNDRDVEPRAAVDLDLPVGNAAPEADRHGGLPASEGAVPAAKVPVAPKTAAPAPRPAADPSSHPGWRGLLSAPLDFMTRRTHLGSAKAFRAFMSDRGRVMRYAGHPLIRAFADSPALMRALLGRPAVVQAFLASPAMQDASAVKALARSGLLEVLIERPGVKSVLTDPAFLSGIMMEPRTLSWLSRNPEASTTLLRAAPAMAGALRGASLAKGR